MGAFADDDECEWGERESRRTRLSDDVRDRPRDDLAERHPSLDWGTEHRIRRTPVDVAGRDSDRFVAVELEWRRIREGSERMLVRKRANRVDRRRADPANNTAKLFYYAAEGEFDDCDEVVVCQLFSGHYDLASGGASVSDASGGSTDESVGVSSKREVAEFVGETAAESVAGVSFHPLRLAVDPPKRGGERPGAGRCGLTKAPPKSRHSSTSGGS